MKLHTTLLTVGLALLPLAGVRADAKSDYLNSLAKPLSPKQMAGLDTLIKANEAMDPGADKTEVQTEAIEEFKKTLSRLPPQAWDAMKPGALSISRLSNNFKVGPKEWPAFVNVSRLALSTAPAERNALYFDIFVASSNQPNAPYQLVKSTRSVAEGNNGLYSIYLEYLKPKLKQGPMLVFTTYQGPAVGLLVFPDGLRGRIVEQHRDFDLGAPDKSGNVTLEQRPFVAHGFSLHERDWIIRSTWNGQRFVPGPKKFIPTPFLIVAGLSKNRAKLDALRSSLQRKIDTSQCEVLPTKEFPRLPRNSYVLIIWRFKTEADAKESLDAWTQSEPYVNEKRFKLRIMHAS